MRLTLQWPNFPNPVTNKSATAHVHHCEMYWFGVTYREDKPEVEQPITRLVVAGDYPSDLGIKEEGS